MYVYPNGTNTPRSLIVFSRALGRNVLSALIVRPLLMCLQGPDVGEILSQSMCTVGSISFCSLKCYVQTLCTWHVAEGLSEDFGALSLR